MARLKYDNIFDTLTADPAEAANLAFRTDMMTILRKVFKDQRLTPSKIAKRLNLSPAEVQDLVSWKIAKFESGQLVGFLGLLGMRLEPLVQPVARESQKLKLVSSL